MNDAENAESIHPKSTGMLQFSENTPACSGAAGKESKAENYSGKEVLNQSLEEEEDPFEQLNKMFCVANQKKVSCESNGSQMKPKNDVGRTTSAGQKKSCQYAIGNEDTIVKLDNDLPGKINVTMLERKPFYFHDKKRDAKILQRHLKFLESFENTRAEKESTEFLKRELHGICNDTPRWWKMSNKFTKSRLLKVSFSSLEKYFEVLSKKVDEIDSASEDLNNEMKKGSKLENDIKEFEKRITAATKAADYLKSSHDEENKRLKMANEELKTAFKSEEARWTKEVKALKSECEEYQRKNKADVERIFKERAEEEKKTRKIIELLKLENQENEALLQKQIDLMRERIKAAKSEQEKAEIKMQELFQENLKKGSAVDEHEAKKLKCLLKEEQEQNKMLSNKLLTLEENSNLALRDLREEVLLKDKLLIDVKERYENQFNAAKLFKKTFSDDELGFGVLNNECNRCLHEKINNIKENNEGQRTTINCPSKYETDRVHYDKRQTTGKHEHFIDLMLNQELEPRLSSAADGSIKTFAIMKVEDVWEEQIHCHQNSVERLKEMQAIRKDLIETRKQLEKAMQENIGLKKSIKSNKKCREDQWKELLNKQLHEMRRKDDEIDNLKLEALKSKQDADGLSKQLQQCIMLQRSKEKEIKLLNATVQAEEYCSITAESMQNFEMHMKKLREENKYLLNYCDKLEERINELQKELDASTRESNNSKGRETALRATCGQLQSELNWRGSSLRQVKEALREVQIEYENRSEELKDKECDRNIIMNKLKKTEKKLLEIEEAKVKLESDNSEIKKRSVDAERDLQKSLDMVYFMKTRYENTEEKFKEMEDKIKQLSDGLVEKGNEMKTLMESKRKRENENERLHSELEVQRQDKDERIAVLEKKNEKQRNDMKRIEMRFEEIEEELTGERKLHEEREREADSLRGQLEEYESKTKNMIRGDDFKVIQSEINELRRENKIVQQDNDCLKQGKKDAESRLATLQCGKEELNSRLQGMQDRVNQLLDEMGEKEKEIKEKEGTLNELTKKLHNETK